MKLFNKFYPFVFILVIWFAFSYPFFLQNKVPFSSTYQMNFFPPWSTYQELAGPVKNNAQPDIITQIYPWKYFTIDEIKNGRIPLWNPYSFSGTPHLANYQSAVLSPLNIIFFVIPKFIDGWSMLVLLQPLFVAFFTYIYSRSLKISKNGSLVSAFSFMFCSFITTWMGYGTLGYAILFLPLALFSIEKFYESKKYVFGVLLSFTIMLSLFSGHFQTSLYFLIATITYLLFKIFTNEKKNLQLILYYSFGILLAMPQLVPSFEFYENSVRSQLFQKVETVPWNYLPTLLSPDFFGNPVTRNDWFGHYAEWGSYAGAIALALAVFNFFSKRIKIVNYFIVFSIVSLLLAFDTPFVTLLVMLKIPVLSTSSVSRVLVLFSFSIAILAGFGFDSLLKNITQKGKKINFWVGSLILIGSIISLYSYFGLDPDKSKIAQKNLILPLMLITLLIFLVYIFKYVKIKSFIFIIPLVIVALSGFDMLRFSSKWQAFDDKGLVFKSVPTTENYQKGFSHDRIFGDFTAENSVYYRILTLGGYDPLYPARYGKFVRYVGNGNISEGERSVVNFPKKGEYVPEALDFLGVKYISHKVSDGTFPWAFPFSDYPVDKFKIIYDDSHYKIFENKDSFKRAFVVNKTKYGESEREILDGVFSNDLSKIAIVGNDLGVNNAGAGSAQIVEYFPGRVKINVDSSEKGLLVLTDNYYPGWRAKVNGQKQNIERVNFTFRGIVIPKGKSIVEMSFIPQSFTFGIYFFMLGIFGIVITSLYNRKTSKK